MNKLLATLIAGFFAVGAFAQTPPAVTKEGASTPPAAQAAGEAKKEARLAKPAAKHRRHHHHKKAKTAVKKPDPTNTSEAPK
ncbi:MAG: hypothetical protein V4505_26960 [Pseudomonadota bacterium]